MADRSVRFAKSTVGVYTAEPVDEQRQGEDTGPSFVVPRSPSPTRDDAGPSFVVPRSPSLPRERDDGNYKVDNPPNEPNNRDNVRLSTIEEVPEDVTQTPRGVHVPEPVEKPDIKSGVKFPFSPEPVKKPDVKSGTQFPFSAEDVPERELANNSRFLEIDPIPDRKVKPGDFTRTPEVLPPIRRGVGEIDHVGRVPDPDRSDDLDKTYEAVGIEPPNITDDLDITYRVGDKKPARISYYGLTHAAEHDEKPHFRDHVTFSPEPVEKDHFRGPLMLHALESAPSRKPLKGKPHELEPIESKSSIRRPWAMTYELQPIEKSSTRRPRAMACAVEQLEKPRIRKETGTFPFITEMSTKYGHTRRYDLFARVPQDVPVPRQRDPGGVRSYRVVGDDDDSIVSTGNELPDEVEYTIDTPRITELDSLGSQITLGEGSWVTSQDGRSGRWEQVSIPGTLKDSQTTFISDTNGKDAAKPSDPRWETVSLAANVAGSRGTLNIDDSERLYGRVERPVRKNSKQDRWERMSTRGTLKGSTGTMRENTQTFNRKPTRELNTPYKSRKDSIHRKDQSRYSGVSLPGSEKGSQGSFNRGHEPQVAKERKRTGKSGHRKAILRDGHIIE